MSTEETGEDIFEGEVARVFHNGRFYCLESIREKWHTGYNEPQDLILLEILLLLRQIKKKLK